MTYILAAGISLRSCCTVALDCTEAVSICFALCCPLQPLAIPDTMAEANKNDGLQKRWYEKELTFCLRLLHSPQDTGTLSERRDRPCPRIGGVSAMFAVMLSLFWHGSQYLPYRWQVSQGISPTKLEILWQYTNSIVVSRAWPKSSSANKRIARDERLFDGQRVASEANHRHPMPAKIISFEP